MGCVCDEIQAIGITSCNVIDAHATPEAVLQVRMHDIRVAPDNHSVLVCKLHA